MDGTGPFYLALPSPPHHAFHPHPHLPPLLPLYPTPHTTHPHTPTPFPPPTTLHDPIWWMDRQSDRRTDIITWTWHAWHGMGICLWFRHGLAWEDIRPFSRHDSIYTYLRFLHASDSGFRMYIIVQGQKGRFHCGTVYSPLTWHSFCETWFGWFDMRHGMDRKRTCVGWGQILLPSLHHAATVFYLPSLHYYCLYTTTCPTSSSSPPPPTPPSPFSLLSLSLSICFPLIWDLQNIAGMAFCMGFQDSPKPPPPPFSCHLPFFSTFYPSSCFCYTSSIPPVLPWAWLRQLCLSVC